MSEAPLLTVSGVVRHFGGIQAVDGASLEVRPGTITALIGPNGAGKTTLFNVISGFVAPQAGTIRFDGHEIAGKPPHRVQRLGLVRTFQIPRALSKLKVLDNVILGAGRHPGERLSVAMFAPWLGRQREQSARVDALAILERVGLASHADAYAATLSGGQKKLLELARALMTRPKLVLLDEPMAGVNPTLGRKLLADLDTLRREDGLTILFVEHDMDVVMGVSDEVVVMSQGMTIVQGPPALVRTDKRVIDAYLGTDDGEAA